MYKTAAEYYKEQPNEKKIKYSYYQGPQNTTLKEDNINGTCNSQTITKDAYKNPENFTCNSQTTTKETCNSQTNIKETYKNPDKNITWKTSNYSNLHDPKSWGPAFWFSLHNGADKYPESASPIVKSRMKSYILGIPIMLPCIKCQIHANEHIELNKKDLDDICSGRKKLFKFFVDFHNKVNKMYNKPIVSVEDAYKMYNGGVNVSVMGFN
jgi:hypothetical protein